MFLDMDKVNRLVVEQYISERRHPSLPLRILNYTPQCQYEWKWTKETIACRGLILDDDDNIVARPFPKFFTPEQYKDLRNSMHHLFGVKYKHMYEGPFTVTEKMDGSLGILYEYDGKRGIATRGSFTSGQAMRATEMLEKHYSQFAFPADRTWLFEIIYPGNRIVVNYGDREELVLLTVLNNDDQTVDSRFVAHWVGFGHPTAPAHNFATFDKLLEYVEDDHFEEESEGFVAYFPDTGIRVKLKYAEYLRLHKILTNVTEKTIWEMLRDGKSPVGELAGFVPDEFHKWVFEVATDLEKRYSAIENHAKGVLSSVKHLDRKSIAATIREYQYKSLVFLMLDGKDYSEAIWKLLKPKATECKL